MRTLRWTTIAITLACTAALGTCGDDSSAAAITKADFVEQANAICDAANEALDAQATALGDSPSTEDIASFIKDDAVPSSRRQIDDIRDLGFPAGDEDELEAVLSDAEDVLDAINEDPEAYATTDEDPFADIDPRLDAYGLTSCGSNGA